MSKFRTEWWIREAPLDQVKAHHATRYADAALTLLRDVRENGDAKQGFRQIGKLEIAAAYLRMALEEIEEFTTEEGIKRANPRRQEA